MSSASKIMRLAAVAALLASFAAAAQEAPAPRKSPRTPVEGQALANAQVTLPPSHDVNGAATIIDGEKLRIDNIELRLFGVVPPQLSASYGPQARGLLDELSAGQTVSCHIRDRDHDGRFLATCRAGSNDLAFELIKRGLAVTARGSLGPTELAAPYEAAEQTAEMEKLGLWSTMQPSTMAPSPAASAPVKAEAAAPLPPNLPASKKEEKPVAAANPPSAAPVVAASMPAPEKIATSVASNAPPQAVAVAAPPAANSDAAGFVARYQLIITTLLMFATALGVSIALGLQRWRDRRDERKAIAAALRGELLAARAVCLARLKTWSDMDEKTAAWPRIRATLYQAYVGRLGQMGATLARQVASIYGQASDYAVYYNASGAHGEFAGKRAALETLMQHIEEVLPKLALIEQTGALPKEDTTLKPVPQMPEPPAPPEEKILPPSLAMTPALTPAPSAVVSAPASAETAVPAALPSASSSGEPAAATPTPAPQASTPVWDRMRNFVRISRAAKQNTPEDSGDYAALIEEEMASLSLDEEKSGEETPPADLGRMGRL